jgi:hypothetical protein
MGRLPIYEESPHVREVFLYVGRLRIHGKTSQGRLPTYGKTSHIWEDFPHIYIYIYIYVGV